MPALYAKHSNHQSSEEFLTKIEALARHPHPHGGRKLSGEKHLWHVPIGDYRVIYAVCEREKRVDITAVRHRKEAYD
ncbi:MAG: type II toxin-antitoxin system RelE family toxin [Nitrospiraceae bacterium]